MLGRGVRGEAHVEFYVVVRCLHSRQYFNVLIPVAIAWLRVCVWVCLRQRSEMVYKTDS